METLLSMSPVVATPLVVEFFFSLLPASLVSKIEDNYKRLISVVVGVILTFLAEYMQGPLFMDGRDLFLLLCAGIVNGAMATGAVALLNKTATRVRSVIDIEQVDKGKGAAKISAHRRR